MKTAVATDISRRRFVHTAAGLAATAAVLGPGGAFAGLFARKPSFPSIRVAGTNFEIGRAIGRRFASEIREDLRRRGGELAALKARALRDHGRLLKGFKDAMAAHTPALLDEIRGTAEGAGIVFDDLCVWNCRPEIEAAGHGGSCGGCTTICVADGRGLFIAHNEDGSRDDADLLYLADVTPPSGVRFVSLTYPGILPGNGPTFNSAGICQTTNFIGAAAFAIGVPRYVVDRATAEAATLDEALKIAAHPQRAYSFHNVFAAEGERRAVSIEVTHDRVHSQPIQGVYVHTNHLVHEGMAGVPQIQEYVRVSTRERYDTAVALLKGAPQVDEAAAVAVLKSHEGAPKGICRHPDGGRRGATLACALFDVARGTARLTRGNPCTEPFAEVAL